MNRNFVVAALFSFAAAGAFAQATDATVQRDAKQQQRIEQGLKDGQLTTREAGKLERDESRVEQLQAKDLRDGKLSPQERAQLKTAQDRTSRDIHAATHNGVHGQPQSASSKRMQADVQRDVDQQKRIEQGVDSGSLTHREVAKLEHGQAKADRSQAVAAHDGHVGAKEQRKLQHQEDRDSRAIHHEKHDAQHREG